MPDEELRAGRSGSKAADWRKAKYDGAKTMQSRI
jgi:hypothetical protein